MYVSPAQEVNSHKVLFNLTLFLVHLVIIKRRLYQRNLIEISELIIASGGQQNIRTHQRVCYENNSLVAVSAEQFIVPASFRVTNISEISRSRDTQVSHCSTGFIH